MDSKYIIFASNNQTKKKAILALDLVVLECLRHPTLFPVSSAIPKVGSRTSTIASDAQSYLH